MIRIWDKKDLLSKVDDTIQNTKKMPQWYAKIYNERMDRDSYYAM